MGEAGFGVLVDIYRIQYFVTVGKTTVFGAQSENVNTFSNFVHIHIIGAATC